MPEPNPPAPTPPAPAPPPAPPAAGDPPAPAPGAAPPAGTRSAAEIENELLKTQLASRQKDADLHKLKEENKRKEEQLSASRQALKAAGIIEDDGGDPKAFVEKHQKEQRARERRDAAIERAALRRLIPTGLGEADADLVLGSILRSPGVSFDETTGAVSGLDEAMAAMKPTIERLTAKPGAPPQPAPPAPPAPIPGGQPMDAEFAGIKTWGALMAKPTTFQEKFEAKYPAEFKRLENEFYNGARAGRQPTRAAGKQAEGSQ